MELSYEPQKSKPETNIKFHMPNIEFWSSIYNAKYLKNNNIKFFEFMEQDIETAFRYRAFANTDRVKICDDICFYIQRNNPKSNMHTVNYLKLYRIKSQVYYGLFTENSLYGTIEDKLYIKSTLMGCIYSYFRTLKTTNNIEKYENKITMLKLLHTVKASDIFKPVWKLGNKEMIKWYYGWWVRCQYLRLQNKRLLK